MRMPTLAVRAATRFTSAAGYTFITASGVLAKCVSASMRRYV